MCRFSCVSLTLWPSFFLTEGEGGGGGLLERRREKKGREGEEGGGSVGVVGANARGLSCGSKHLLVKLDEALRIRFFLSVQAKM